MIALALGTGSLAHSGEARNADEVDHGAGPERARISLFNSSMVCAARGCSCNAKERVIGIALDELRRTLPTADQVSAVRTHSLTAY